MSEKTNVNTYQEKQSQNASATSTDNVREMFEDAYNVYIQALMETQTDVQKQYDDIYQAYFGDLSEGQKKAQQNFQDVNTNYLQAMKAALDSQEQTTRWEDIYEQSVNELNQSQTLLQTDCDSAYEKYRENLQKLLETTQQHNLDSCHAYLGAVKKSWSKLNVEQIDSNTLSTIVQTISAAGSFASAALTGKQQNDKL